MDILQISMGYSFMIVRFTLYSFNELLYLVQYYNLEVGKQMYITILEKPNRTYIHKEWVLLAYGSAVVCTCKGIYTL